MKPHERKVRKRRLKLAKRTKIVHWGRRRAGCGSLAGRVQASSVGVTCKACIDLIAQWVEAQRKPDHASGPGLAKT